MSFKTLKHVSLAGHSRTGRTRHTRDGVHVGHAASLRIVQFDGDPGFSLIHFDSTGRELTDTYHHTIEDAMKQADWEYGVKPDEWRPWVN
jgi:hypothetical protein